MGRLFGTDGVRGVANVDLTSELALQIGRAAAMVLLKESKSAKPTVLTGKDTRASGDMLEAALTAGLCSVGCNVTILANITELRFFRATAIILMMLLKMKLKQSFLTTPRKFRFLPVAKSAIGFIAKRQGAIMLNTLFQQRMFVSTVSQSLLTALTAVLRFVLRKYLLRWVLNA